MYADSLAENAPELICPICLPKPRSSGFQWKKTWVSIDRVINLSDLVDILNLLDFADIFDHIFSLMDLSNLWDLSELQSCANTKNAFFACFRPYVGQSDTHISWVTLMPFPSIYPTDPRTNPAQFCEKILRIDGFEKCSFFESAILEFCFCLIPWKAFKGSWVARMVRNDYPGLQRMRSWANTYAQDCIFCDNFFNQTW